MELWNVILIHGLTEILCYNMELNAGIIHWYFIE